ncbi:MAG: tetratricopeptide repeat protein [Alphaproteobacteria bacterium]
MRFPIWMVVGLGALLVAVCSGPERAWAMGSDPAAGAAKGSPDYTKAEKAVKDKDFKGAIALFEKIIATEPRNANALNYLGYSHRNLGEREKALGYYKRALDIEPNHLGANEYLGELYLQMGDLAAAEERLKVLDRACRNCEEKRDLAEKIEKHKKAKGS